MHKVYITKQNGERELFDFTKLKKSLKNSGASNEIADSIVDLISKEMKDETTTAMIYDRAFMELSLRARHAAARYSLKRALAELGPSGFPFEQFMAEIYRARGFEVVTNQFVRGHCTEHEVDLVLWNDQQLIMAEAKFHHHIGLKSDLKIALYIKARFDDLKGIDMFYGKKRKLSDWLLITNTKFTERAISYGKCAGLNLIGWNYPHGNNLHDLIEGAGLHPVTCLKSLNSDEKKRLIDAGYVLCRRASNAELLKSLGFENNRIDEIIREISQVCLPPIKGTK